MKELQGSSKLFQLFISKVHFLKKQITQNSASAMFSYPFACMQGVFAPVIDLADLARLSKTKCWLWAARPRPGYGIFSDEIRDRVKEAVGIL